MLPALLIGPLLLLWLPMARTVRVRLVVASLVATMIAVAALLGAAFPRGVFECTLAALLTAVALITGATVREQRRRGSEPWPARIWWVRTLSAVVLMVALGGFGALIRPGPFVPPAEDVLPLPAGLTAVAEPVGDCGSGVCERLITVTGRPGVDLAAEVTRHLRTRGWPATCRPGSWLLDRARECVHLVPGQDSLTIVLSGGT